MTEAFSGEKMVERESERETFRNLEMGCSFDISATLAHCSRKLLNSAEARSCLFGNSRAFLRWHVLTIDDDSSIDDGGRKVVYQFLFDGRRDLHCTALMRHGDTRVPGIYIYIHCFTLAREASTMPPRASGCVLHRAALALSRSAPEGGTVE